ncbi:hypothetical protein HZC32_01570 [Candidatus Woesearchaeota archaeon]|nr:hypothetical protein [Candidatus Woesearchaeota archaeon]
MTVQTEHIEPTLLLERVMCVIRAIEQIPQINSLGIRMLLEKYLCCERDGAPELATDSAHKEISDLYHGMHYQINQVGALQSLRAIQEKYGS